MSDKVKRSAKRVRRRPGEPSDSDDPIVNDKGMNVDLPAVQTSSWEDKLLGKDDTSVGATIGNLDKDTLNQGGVATDSSINNNIAHDGGKGDRFRPWMLVERKPRRKPMTTAKEITSNPIVRTEGSRFGILSRNHGVIGELVSGTFDSNTGNRGFVESILGTKLQARGNLPFNPLAKNKGKIVISVNGPKNVLKPVNKNGSLFGSVENPFDDGSKMGPKLMENRTPIKFQAIRHGQVLRSLPEGECSTLLISRAIDDLIMGLCQEVRQDTALLGGNSSLRESDNETLVDATLT
ncbi:hypothetical protein Goklo_007544 [Gossypium klotzschianum]|uniref:Uncharacterized protein n=1 Tax=Gossypium klotzschianum TaxID=34286 RepID=A0A7J8UWY5_9ROSI|nr:hypothetical protein [Gossypium klotzschianum]